MTPSTTARSAPAAPCTNSGAISSGPDMKASRLRPGRPLAKAWYEGSMKSGPTLNPVTARPRAAKAPSRPVATVVLPAPEWVPATTSRAVTAAPRSPLDPLLPADATLEGVLDLAHLGDQVGAVQQLGGRVAAGDHDVLEPGPFAQH